jgi:hypothetical protein
MHSWNISPITFLFRPCFYIYFCRAQVSALLAEIPQRRLPLFKFRELYEQRYTTSVMVFGFWPFGLKICIFKPIKTFQVSLADLHRLRDILHVTDDVHGRCVVFLQNQHQPSKVHQYSGEQSSRDILSVSRSNSSISEVWGFFLETFPRNRMLKLCI